MILKQTKIKEYLLKNSNNICCISNLENDLVLDHCHKTGFVRKPINRKINRWLGKIENAYIRFVGNNTKDLPNLLRNIADYLEQDYSNNPIHPSHIKKITNNYLKLDLEKQKEILTSFNLESNNAKIRKSNFRKLLLKGLIDVI